MLVLWIAVECGEVLWRVAECCVLFRSVVKYLGVLWSIFVEYYGVLWSVVECCGVFWGIGVL